MGRIPQIISDSNVCHGKPVISGTRVMVWQILELLETGESPVNIYKAYPSLPSGAVESALHYAAELIKSEFDDSKVKENQPQVFA